MTLAEWGWQAAPQWAKDAKDADLAQQGSDANGYDYRNQAWVKDGKYVRCGHPVMFVCACYGRKHEGESLAPNADVH